MRAYGKTRVSPGHPKVASPERLGGRRLASSFMSCQLFVGWGLPGPGKRRLSRDFTPGAETDVRRGQYDDCHLWFVESLKINRDNITSWWIFFVKVHFHILDINSHFAANSHPFLAKTLLKVLDHGCACTNLYGCWSNMACQPQWWKRHLQRIDGLVGCQGRVEQILPW